MRSLGGFAGNKASGPVVNKGFVQHQILPKRKRRSLALRGAGGPGARRPWFITLEPMLGPGGPALTPKNPLNVKKGGGTKGGNSHFGPIGREPGAGGPPSQNIGGA